MGAYDAGKLDLVRAREARHFHVGDQIAAMLVVLVVGNVHADLVKIGGPTQLQSVRRPLQVPRQRDLGKETECGVPHAARMGSIDVVARREIRHGGFANVVMLHASQQILQQTFAQCALRSLNVLDTQGVDDGTQYRQAARKTGRRSFDRPGNSILSIAPATITLLTRLLTPLLVNPLGS